MRESESAELPAIENIVHSEASRTAGVSYSPSTSPELAPPLSSVVPSYAVSHLAILSSVSVGQEEWSREACRAILVRYGRMPRFGWKRLVDVFCDKFLVSLSVEEIKLKSQSLLVTENGRRCTIRDFVDDPGKRHRLAESVFDQGTHNDANLFIRI